MSVAGDAQTLGAAMNHSSLNIANALGAWLGGLVIAAGWGYRAPALVGVVLSLGGLGVLRAVAARAPPPPRRLTPPATPVSGAVPTRRGRCPATVGAPYVAGATCVSPSRRLRLGLRGQPTLLRGRPRRPRDRAWLRDRGRGRVLAGWCRHAIALTRAGGRRDHPGPPSGVRRTGPGPRRRVLPGGVADAGGRERVAPRFWPEYRAYCAFVDDPDGNNIEAVHKEAG